jgi:hypothetical protein
MTDGTSKTLAITDLPDNVDAGVTSVAISSDGRLVAAGSLDTVRHFSNCQLVVLLIQSLIGRTYLGHSNG